MNKSGLYVRFLLLGVFFGILAAKAEFVSWYRIHEMFNFESFHMYGIIGSAVVLGAILMQIIRRSDMKTKEGKQPDYCPKAPSIPRYLFGGIFFGIGWAMTGACPGPMYTLVGAVGPVFLVVLASAVLGTFVYGLMRPILPH